MRIRKNGRVINLTESDLRRIVKENERKFKSNKKQDDELNLQQVLNSIFFGNDKYNLFSDSGEFGYLSSEHSLQKKISPRQRQERIYQVIDLLEDYIELLKSDAKGTGGYFQDPNYGDVWDDIEYGS